ncbi:hypothetical protein Tco_0828525 [Tanacetum coccineum]
MKQNKCRRHDTRPPMLVENDYESWKIRIHRYIRGKPNGKLIWKSIQDGPTPHPMVTDPPPANSTLGRMLLTPTSAPCSVNVAMSQKCASSRAIRSLLVSKRRVSRWIVGRWTQNFLVMGPCELRASRGVIKTFVGVVGGVAENVSGDEREETWWSARMRDMGMGGCCVIEMAQKKVNKCKLQSAEVDMLRGWERLCWQWSQGRTVADSIAERLTRPNAYKVKTDCSIIPVWGIRLNASLPGLLGLRPTSGSGFPYMYLYKFGFPWHFISFGIYFKTSSEAL